MAPQNGEPSNIDLLFKFGDVRPSSQGGIIQESALIGITPDRLRNIKHFEEN
jgi:hypothetical protein